MTTKVQLGSISHGTMRPADLISTFIEKLTALGHNWEGIDITYPGSDGPGWDNAHPEEAYYAGQDAQDDLEYLFDALNEYAPPFCYFGAHEGDGSDYGFWLSEAALEDGLQTKEIVKTEDMPDYRLDVNDHGNMTLYDKNGDEVWAVV